MKNNKIINLQGIADRGSFLVGFKNIETYEKV